MVGAYLVGDPSAADAVLVAADAPGWRAPGIRRFARLLHRVSGALVVVPDLARGDTWYGDPDPAKRTREKTFAEWRGGHPAERIAADAAAIHNLKRGRPSARPPDTVGTRRTRARAVHAHARAHDAHDAYDTRTRRTFPVSVATARFWR